MVKYLSLLFAALAFPAFTATAQYIDPEAEDVDSVAVEVVEELPTVVEEPKSEINYDQLEKRWNRKKCWNIGDRKSVV